LNTASNTSGQHHQDAAPKDLISRLKNINRVFALTVLAPTVLATAYYGLIASDVYVSESRFVVRSAKQQPQLSTFGALLAGSGFSQTSEDTYPVIDYIESRDALRELNKDNYIVQKYSQYGDLFSRFHTGIDSSFEALWRYYGKHIVSVTSDPTSGIVTLQVRAYTATDAANINTALLRLSEQLVNRMNARAASDTVDFAQREVESSALKAKEAATALAAYRNTHAIFDPDRQSALRLQQVTALQTQLFSAQSQLTQLYAISPQNPQIPALKTSIASIQKQIDETSGTVAGSENSLSQKVTEYERLQLDSQFADKQLATAMTALENARDDAARKQLYLEDLVQPNTPDIAIEPKRLRNIATIFALGVVCWGVLSLLLASIREHRD
jgi:capsular polysaccharide transport system permease protein